MPTFNQLVRKGRKVQQYKSTAPALQKAIMPRRRLPQIRVLRRREASAQQFVLLHRRSRTPL